LIVLLSALLTLAEAAAAPAGGDAEALFRDGLKAYDAKQYVRAIESFEAAHKLSPLPEILFDIAMARRALGDCPRAAADFDAFIAAAPADDPLLARARARRAELGSCADATGDAGKTAASRTAAAGRPSPVAPVVPPAALDLNAPSAPATLIAASAPMPPPGQRERSWLRDTCVGSLAGTSVLAVGGVVFGWRALAAQSDVEDATVWDSATERADERGRAFGQVATTLLISAGVTAAVAATSCFVLTRPAR
jgi:tetratricopeptide (TPR) repeat protein